MIHSQRLLQLKERKLIDSGIAKLAILKFFTTGALVMLVLFFVRPVQAQELNSNRLALPVQLFEDFYTLYENELGSVRPCQDNVGLYEYKVCSKALRNEGNSPFILYSKGMPSANGKRQIAPIVVLFHGLSDSPFYIRSIAEHLNDKGFTVVAPLTPGNGKLDAANDMRDPTLQQRWYAHVDSIMNLISPYSDKTYIGGFSTGGTLATRYMLLHPDEIDGLLLFSGALALSESAENLGQIWGMKWIAKIVDGDFVSTGANPYRYPDVAGYAGLTLADVIFEIRYLLAETTVSKPIFVAHSLADIITPYYGVEDLMAKIDGEHQVMTIDRSYDMCHQDLVMSSMMMIGLKIDKTQLNISERCAIPKPNPLFNNMMAMLDYFFEQQLKGQ
ncbi:MAG: pimeloyl-ACP methyl ester carboxylesterase [Glaciecola sp.]|jgi:pimeloyl-ACP methyl ester carboxylesterase